MKKLILILFMLILMWSYQAWTFEIHPTIEKSKLIINISQLQIPSHATKDFTSGLANTLRLDFIILKEGKILQQSSTDYFIVYDLWEEQFSLQHKQEKSTFATLQDLLAYLNKISFPTHISIDQKENHDKIKIVVRVLVNPLNNERYEKIKQWIANQSVTVFSNEGRGRASTSSPRLNNLFMRIYDEYSKDSNKHAVWSTLEISAAFLPVEIPHVQ